MGTSLSGLTPATTFDGLLKTGDNDPIGATLKTISDGSGNDSVLQLSNSALQVNGPTTINGAQMTIVGATNDNTTNALVVQNSDGIELLKVRNERYAQLGTSTIGIHTLISSNANWIKGNANYLQDTSSNYYGNIGSSGIQIGNGSAAATARLQIKGSGATSATTSLLVQNSAGANVIKANDDGRVLLGAGTSYQNHLLELNGQGLGSSQTLLRLQSSVNFNGAYTGIGFTNSTNGSSLSSEIRSYRESYGNALTFNFSGTEMLRATSEGNLGIGETTPTARLHVKAGTTQDTIARFQDPLNASTYIDIKNDSVLTDYVGLFWGGKAKIRSKEVGPIFIDSSQAVVFADGNAAKTKIYADGSMSIGSSTIPSSTMTYIKGSGNDDQTTALLVQNSDGDELLKVTDDGVFEIGNTNAQVSTLAGKLGLKGNTIQIKPYGNTMLHSSIHGVAIGNGENNSTARLQVKGSGATSATTALLVENSAGTELLNVRDDGKVTIADTLQIGSLTQSSNKIVGSSIRMQPHSGGLSISATAASAPSSTMAYIKGSGATSATTALLVQNSDGTDLFKVFDTGATRINTETLSSTIIGKNGTGGGFIVDAGRVNNIRADVNGVAINSTPTANTSLTIKGSGASAGTTALLVENSAGTDLMSVRDDGRIVAGIGATTNANGTFNVLHGITDSNTRVFTVSRDSVLRGIDINSGGSTKISDSTGDQSFSHTATAVLEVSSTTQGFLPPRMTTEQKNAITSPEAGLMVYDTVQNQMNYYNGSNWVAF